MGTTSPGSTGALTYPRRPKGDFAKHWVLLLLWAATAGGRSKVGVFNHTQHEHVVRQSLSQELMDTEGPVRARRTPRTGLHL